MSAWFAMKQASAGANVVNAVSLSVNTAIHTDMLPVASVTSSAAAMRNVAASASTPPASASESAPIATDKADNSLNTSKAAEKSAAFSDANSNRSKRVVSRHRSGTPTCGAQLGWLSHVGAFAPRSRCTNQTAQIVTNERMKNAPHKESR